MPVLAHFAIAFAVVFCVNLMPAFGPPTWALLVFFSLDFNLAPAPLVLGGAIAAAGGRFVLANAARRLRHRFSPAQLHRLGRVEAILTADRRRAGVGLGLFAVSPLPSGQLFVAAGLLTVPLLPLTAAFFAGRLVSYSLYVALASVAERNLGSLALDSLTSPLGIALQLLALAALPILVGRSGGGSRRNGSPPAAAPSAPAPAARSSRR